jgi:hypothetical protein
MTDNLDLIAPCGLYCGECPAHLGTIADMARDLRKELRKSRFDLTAASMSKMSFFAALKNYASAYDVLGAMVKLRCKKGCRGYGGNPFCEIRKCCQKKNIDGCWECDVFETCNKLDFLCENHGSAHIKNLKILRKSGVERFLEGKKHWYSPPG